MAETQKAKRRLKPRSLTATLGMGFVALSLVVLVLASSLQLYAYFLAEQAVVAGKQRLIAQNAANEVRSFIQDRFEELKAAVKFSDLSNPTPAVVDRNLGKLLGLQPAFRQLIQLDVDGQVIARSSRRSQTAGSKAMDRFRAEALARTSQKEQYISPAYIDEITFEPLLVMAVPVQDIFGDYQGSLIAEVNLKFMWDLVDRLKVGETGVAYVVDRPGNLLAFGDITRVLAGENLSNLAEIAEFVKREDVFSEFEEEGMSVSTGINGTRVVAAYVPLGTPDWAVVTELPVVEAYTDVIQNFAISGMIILIIAVLAGITGVYLARSLAAPLHSLTETVTRITGGETQLQAKVEGPTEVAQLAEAFNKMTSQLQILLSSLEEQVQERTAELSLSMEVGQRASVIRNLGELLPTITEFIREQFDLYYVHVYFVDDISENLVIKAGTGTVGQELLARRHMLPVGPGSIVGQVAATGQSIVVSDTEQSEIHKPNPLLPHTRSELAVPLTVEGRVIGVLDMQSDQANTFTEKNLTVFEAMGIQLAISIDSAQQWTVSQHAQQRAEEALKRLTRETWSENLVTRREIPAYAYDLSIVTPVGSQTENGGVSVPVAVQNQAIGELSVKTSNGRALSADEQALMNAVAQQLAQKAENLRLFEQTQQRATREQIARQITDKIRASDDIESALKTAVVELSKALGAARAVVDLQVRRSSDESDQK